MQKPRSSICWLCGAQLYQHKIHVEKEIDGHSRIVHKRCLKYLNDDPDHVFYLYDESEDD